MSYCLAMTLAAALVVGGSWFALELMQKRVSPGMFAGGWVALLAVTYLLNRILPKAPVEAEAYAPKLFSTRDNHNRELLATKVALFVPNIVLHAVTSWFELLVPRRR